MAVTTVRTPLEYPPGGQASDWFDFTLHEALTRRPRDTGNCQALVRCRSLYGRHSEIGLAGLFSQQRKSPGLARRSVGLCQLPTINPAFDHHVKHHN